MASRTCAGHCGTIYQMKTNSLILYQTVITVDGIDYLVAADVRGTKDTYREGFEHFGSCGSHEQSDVEVECEGFSAFDSRTPDVEILDKAILLKIKAELEEEIKSDAVLDRFDFD